MKNTMQDPDVSRLVCVREVFTEYEMKRRSSSSSPNRDMSSHTLLLSGNKSENECVAPATRTSVSCWRDSETTCDTCSRVSGWTLKMRVFSTFDAQFVRVTVSTSSPVALLISSANSPASGADDCFTQVNKRTHLQSYCFKSTTNLTLLLPTPKLSGKDNSFVNTLRVTATQNALLLTVKKIIPNIFFLFQIDF